MVKHLTKHGNSLALVINKEILQLLGIDACTPLRLTTDGSCLVVSRAKDSERRKQFKKAMEAGNRRYGRMLKRLSD